MIEEWEVGNLVYISFDNKENGTTRVVNLQQFTIIFLLVKICVHYCMYGTFSFSIKFKHIVVLYLVFIGKCNTICILLVNTIIYLILIGDVMYCYLTTKSLVLQLTNTFFFFQRKHHSSNSFTTNYWIIKLKLKYNRILYIKLNLIGVKRGRMEKGRTKMKKKRRFSPIWLERKGGRKIVRWGGFST